MEYFSCDKDEFQRTFLVGQVNWINRKKRGALIFFFFCHCNGILANKRVANHVYVSMRKKKSVNILEIIGFEFNFRAEMQENANQSNVESQLYIAK